MSFGIKLKLANVPNYFQVDVPLLSFMTRHDGSDISNCAIELLFFITIKNVVNAAEKISDYICHVYVEVNSSFYARRFKHLDVVGGMVE